MKLDSTSAFLSVIAAAMFSVTCVLIALLVCVPEGTVAPECGSEALKLECADGYECNDSKQCVQAEVVETTRPICMIGQRIDRCECPTHLDIRDGVCVQLTVAGACEHPGVNALLRKLRDACEENALDLGNLEGCNPTALREVLAGNPRDVLSIADALRDHTFSLHFARNTPAKGLFGGWPGRAERRQLDEEVKNYLEAIDPHGYILFFAISSYTGAREINLELAARRSDAAVKIIGELRHDFPALGERLHDIELLVGLIGFEERTALTIDTFDAIWGASGRFRAWDEVNTRLMRDRLARWRAGTLDAKGRVWLAQTINQAVMVIPLPCQLREAHG